MHKYNKALRSGLGCSSTVWWNEGDWRCMCPGIGTGTDPSSPNYPHSTRPCGTLCRNICMWLLSHPRAPCAHNPLHVTSCCTSYQWAIFRIPASSGRTNLAENKSIFNNYDDGEVSKAPRKSLIRGAESADKADLSSSENIPRHLHATLVYRWRGKKFSLIGVFFFLKVVHFPRQ